MTTFNTGNPIGSTDARDLSDNAENFDTALGTTAATWVDRFGVTRDSFEGRLAKGSFYRVGTFAAGYTLTNMRQTLEYNGHEYSWAGTFPKVVAAGATPATSGGIGAGAWVDRTDLNLRSELSSKDGRKLIGACEDIATLRLTEPTSAQQRIDVIGYYSNTPLIGGGTFYYDENDITSADDGGVVFVTPSGARWKRWLGGSVAVATPYDFGCIGDGVTYDQVGLVAYDAYCNAAGIPFDGLGLTYATTALILTSGDYKNANFVPFSGHTGDGPTFTVNSNTGICLHENIKVNGFTNNGARISRGTYAGVATFTSSGINDYSNNGGLIRTTTTAEVDMATAYVIPVNDETEFSVDDLVWIGDGKYTVLSTSPRAITLVNNGAQATLVFGSRNKFASGQYVTVDGDGKNGITIGDGGDGWNLYIGKNSLTANDCGWFGLFHWANARNGEQELDTVHASRNGFIGVGLGYTNKGYARGCVTEYNGNNGIDTFSSTPSFSIHNGKSRYNGVEGVYLGGDSLGGIGRFHDYDCRYNRRMGWLLNASTIAAAYSIHHIDARDNDYRSFTLTGCGVGTISECKLGGATYDRNAYFEGKNGCSGLQNHTISNCSFYGNNGGFVDIGGNTQNYVAATAGQLNIIDTYRFDGTQITADVTNVDPIATRCRPNQRLEISVSATSAAAGAAITLTVNFKRPFNSSISDLSTNMAKFTVYTSSGLGTQSSLTSVTRTAGVEIVAGTAHWICSGNFGTITYSLSLSSAGTRHILVELDGFKRGVDLRWV